MVDLNKVKERLEAQSKKNGGGNQNKFKESIFFKPEKPGKYVFRAVAYPHVHDRDAEPFAEKYYHFNIPGNYAVYCPEKNDGEKCALCRLCWDNLKALKGGNDPKAREEWSDRLPQLQVMLPGKLVGMVDEDDAFIASESNEVKFLKFRSSYEKDKDGKSRMSENHKKLYDNFKPEPNWLDWKKGCNLEMVYEAPSAAQKAKFTKANVMLAKGGVNLARKDSQAFESESEYDAFIESIPNLDTYETYAKKSSEDINEVLEKWQKFAENKAAKLNAESKTVSKKTEEVVIENVPEHKEERKIETPPTNVTKLSALEKRLKEAGVR